MKLSKLTSTNLQRREIFTANGHTQALEKQKRRVSANLATFREKKMADVNKAITTIFLELQHRTLHPAGYFDKAGRWYTDYPELISVRTPSRSYPFSEMAACRTKKYVAKIAEKFGCKTVKTLRRVV